MNRLTNNEQETVEYPLFKKRAPQRRGAPNKIRNPFTLVVGKEFLREQRKPVLQAA
ncbi:hypothetical protein SAMN04488121_106201 [Chitinophaga filiformis]|uniref:Uncharacterized protein n=1 Tax=Chitinophaga filiformis TaxID=104663 RepID=A0A1G7WXA6_CHIFI|nr:hypothetical protein SAMN04488121_106201 [Chitinophaga filiformis]